MERIKKLMENKFIKGGSLLTISTILCQVIGFVFSMFAYNIMGEEAYGNFGLYLTTLAIVNTIGTMNLSNSITRGKFEFENEFDSFFKSILIVGTLLGVISSVIFIIANVFLDKLGIIEGSWMGFPIIILLGIHSVSNYIYNCNMSKLTVNYKHKEYAITSVLNSVLMVGIVIIFFTSFSWNTYIERVVGTVITMLGFAIFLVIKNRKSEFKYNKKYLTFAISYSFPLIMHTLSTVILNYFDSIVIKIYEMDGQLGIGTQGVYALSYKIATIITILWTVLNKLWVPWFFEKMNEKENDKIKKVGDGYVDIFTYLFFAFLFVLPDMRFFMEESFSHALKIIPIIASGFYFVFLNSFLSNTEFYRKKTKYVGVGTLLAGVLNIVLNIIFIPKFGDIAAAFATAFSFFILFIYHIIINDFILKDKVFQYKMYLKGIILMTITVFTYYSLLEYTLIRWGILMVTTGVIYIIYRRKISWLS